MARKALLVRGKTTNKRIGATAQHIADSRYMGDEPEVYQKSLNRMELLKVLNWYNYMCTRNDAREFLESYLKSNNRLSDLESIEKVSDCWIIPLTGWISRILSRGGLLPSDSIQKLENNIQDMISKIGHKPLLDVDSTVSVEKPKVSVQERMADKASEIIGELEETIDSKGIKNINVYEWLSSKQISAIMAKRIQDFYNPILNEYKELFSTNCDSQLLEGYKKYTKLDKKDMVNFYTGLILDCDKFYDTAKKQRDIKPRKKRAINIDNKLKTFNYQKESKEYKIASINPTKILGCQELWIFNTKYKTVHVFHSLNGGLNIQGTTIKNYDPSVSKGYRTGRSTEEHLSVFMKGGKRIIGKILESLSECTLQHRCNENTILMRVG